MSRKPLTIESGVFEQLPDGEALATGPQCDVGGTGTYQYYSNLPGFQQSGSSQIGTLKISLPVGKTNTMHVFRLLGYHYSTGWGGWQLLAAGYNYTGGSAWVRCSADVSGRPPFGTVRFAYDGNGNGCLLLGTTTSSWHYPVVKVAEVLQGLNDSDYSSGWDISLVTDESAFTGITNVPILRSEFGYTLPAPTATNQLLTATAAGAAEWTDTITVAHLNMKGPIASTGDTTAIAQYEYLGRAYTPGGSGMTCKITLPHSWTQTMTVIKLLGYNYTSSTGPWEAVIGAYAHTTTYGWRYPHADLLGKPPFSRIRLAHDGTYVCVLLGDATTNWSNASVAVTDILQSLNVNNLSQGCTVEWITDESGLTPITEVPIVRSDFGHTLSAPTAANQLLKATAASTAEWVSSLETLTVDNLTLDGDMITSATGQVDFGDDDLTTTGQVTAAAIQIGGDGGVSAPQLEIVGDYFSSIMDNRGYSAVLKGATSDTTTWEVLQWRGADWQHHLSYGESAAFEILVQVVYSAYANNTYANGLNSGLYRITGIATRDDPNYNDEADELAVTSTCTLLEGVDLCDFALAFDTVSVNKVVVVARGKYANPVRCNAFVRVLEMNAYTV